MWSISSKGAEFLLQGRRAMTEAAVHQMSTLITRTVKAKKSTGCLKAAITDAARTLGLSERRIRAGIYHEIRSVSADEWKNVRLRFAQHLKDEARRHLAEIEADFETLKDLEDECHDLEILMSKARERVGAPREMALRPGLERAGPRKILVAAEPRR